MIGVRVFPRSLQRDSFSCGTRSVFVVLQYFNRQLPYEEVFLKLKTDHNGTNVKPILNLFRKLGLKTGRRSHMTFKQLRKVLKYGGVAILDVDGDHFIVCHGVDLKEKRVYVADPAITRTFGSSISIKKLKKRWDRSGIVVGLSRKMPLT